MEILLMSPLSPYVIAKITPPNQDYMSDLPETLNIPAYQRKRSIAAKARKTSNNSTKKPAKVSRKRLDPIDPIHEVNIVDDVSFEPLKPRGARTSKFKEMRTCGSCEGYFEKINVGLFKLSTALRVGDLILIEIEDGLYQQEVKSIQIDRKEVKLARAGSDIGMKIEKQPKIGGTIYKVI